MRPRLGLNPSTDKRRPIPDVQRVVPGAEAPLEAWREDRAGVGMLGTHIFTEALERDARARRAEVVGYGCADEFLQRRKILCGDDFLQSFRDGGVEIDDLEGGDVNGGNTQGE